MTAHSEPSRPREEWFAPYGEGYCTECRFIVPLDERGRLESHRRGLMAAGRYGPYPGFCIRSLTRPAPASRVPYAARRSRFRYEPPVARCPECLANVRTSVLGDSDRPFYLSHRRSTGYGICPMAGHEVRR